MGSLNRHMEHFSAEDIGGADAAGNHSGSGAVNACVRSLGAAKSEFHNPVTLGCIYHPRCLGGNQRLVVDNIKKGGFNQLSLHNRRDDFDKGLTGKYNCAFRNSINIAGKMEIFQIFQKILFKQSCAAKVVDIILFKMQIFNIFDDLLQTGTDRVAAPYRVAAVKCIENDGFIGILFLKISLHHSQLIEICQQSKITFTHRCSPSPGCPLSIEETSDFVGVKYR